MARYLVYTIHVLCLGIVLSFTRTQVLWLQLVPYFSITIAVKALAAATITYGKLSAQCYSRLARLATRPAHARGGRKERKPILTS